MVSIIVPIYNEEKNIQNLLEQIDAAFKNKADNYEVIIIDDNSTDRSWKILQEQKSKYPIRFFKKKGIRGKAYSLFEGFYEAKGEIIAMIDADLQYPPKFIYKMAAQIDKNADIIVANRKNYQDALLRKILSRSFKIFGKVVFGLDCDIQSGLKVFRQEVIKTVKFNPQSPWTFDLEFLYIAKRAGCKTKNMDITFYPRKNGQSQIKIMQTIFEIMFYSIKLKFKMANPNTIYSHYIKTVKSV